MFMDVACTTMRIFFFSYSHFIAGIITTDICLNVVLCLNMRIVNRSTLIHALWIDKMYSSTDRRSRSEKVEQPAASITQL